MVKLMVNFPDFLGEIPLFPLISRSTETANLEPPPASAVSEPSPPSHPFPPFPHKPSILCRQLGEDLPGSCARIRFPQPRTSAECSTRARRLHVTRMRRFRAFRWSLPLLLGASICQSSRAAQGGGAGRGLVAGVEVAILSRREASRSGVLEECRWVCLASPRAVGFRVG